MLAKLASAKVVINNRTIIQETLQIPCTNKVMNGEERELWMLLTMNFLKWGKLSSDKKEARMIEH